MATPTTSPDIDRRLAVALTLDAAASGALGLLLVVAAGPADRLLGLPESLGRSTGAFLLVWAVVVWLVAVRPTIGGVRVVVAVNALWVVGSIGYAVGAAGLTAPGTAFVLVQALAVLAFAVLQVPGTRATLRDSSN